MAEHDTPLAPDCCGGGHKGGYGLCECDCHTDWEAEVRGLGYMILTIANRYEAARTAKRPSWWSRRKWRLGGDDELLWSSVMQAKAYCEGPLGDRLNTSRQAGKS